MIHVRHELRIGPFTPAAPVVLAPMAGVTNTAFRSMCRQFAPGLIYVNEMVMSTAVVHGNAKTDRMMTFAADEQPRSLQMYGSDPVMIGEAIRKVCAAGRVDHVDLNFGCPAAKVTRKGGGAAVPAKPKLLRAILHSAVGAAAPYGVPVTAKFRIGLTPTILTHIQTGLIAAEEGVAAIALHARTAEQHYAGTAHWDAIGELKAAVTDIPVLGNGDIWEAADAIAMMQATDCDGVVIGRGCLGRPWLFRDLVEALNGRPVPTSPVLGEVCAVMYEHAVRLLDHLGPQIAMRDFRKHTSWYLTGYPVGGEMRGRFAMISTIGELEDLIAQVDPTITIVEGGERIRRGHTNGPIRVALPDGYLDHLDDDTVPDDDTVMSLSGG
ncbi:MAG: tRNA-dihydrouridine synthase [Actinomycetota bacterium]